MALVWMILLLAGLALFQSLLLLALFFSTLLLNKRLFKRDPTGRMLLPPLFIMALLSMVLTFSFGWWLFSATDTSHALLLALIPPLFTFPGLFKVIKHHQHIVEDLDQR
jgi:hypothetical protein